MKSIKECLFTVFVLLLFSFVSVFAADGGGDAGSNNESYILTPKPPAKPRINGAKIFGVRPGSPFLFTIPATGERPIKFSASGLPGGLKLNDENGQITGSVGIPGTYYVMLKAENSEGKTEREFRIVVGDKAALTPPMGWNSWNGWGHHITDEQVRASAEAMVKTGLINHGWTYINIDVGWSGQRGGRYNAIQPNEKFPDMRGLCDYVHSIGLKIGVYSTPWINTYFGFTGGSSDSRDGLWSKPKTKEEDDKGHRTGNFSFG